MGRSCGIWARAGKNRRLESLAESLKNVSRFARARTPALQAPRTIRALKLKGTKTELWTRCLFVMRRTKVSTRKNLRHFRGDSCLGGRFPSLSRFEFLVMGVGLRIGNPLLPIGAVSGTHANLSSVKLEVKRGLVWLRNFESCIPRLSFTPRIEVAGAEFARLMAWLGKASCCFRD